MDIRLPVCLHNLEAFLFVVTLRFFRQLVQLCRRQVVAVP